MALRNAVPPLSAHAGSAGLSNLRRRRIRASFRCWTGCFPRRACRRFSHRPGRAACGRGVSARPTIHPDRPDAAGSRGAAGDMIFTEASANLDLLLTQFARAWRTSGPDRYAGLPCGQRVATVAASIGLSRALASASISGPASSAAPRHEQLAFNPLNRKACRREPYLDRAAVS